MRVSLLLCVLLSVSSLSGCRKKSSPEFFKLEADQSILVARDGDDAWVSPEMSDILAALQRIPQDAIEGPRVAALVAKILAEQARVKAEQAPVPPPPDPFAGRLTAEPTPPSPESAGVLNPGVGPDAGVEVTMPFSGMDEKAFVTRFGTCFSAGKKKPLPDGKLAGSYVIGSSAACQKQFGSPDGVLMYLFTEKGLWGQVIETTRVFDAGRITVPAPPPPPDPASQPTIITVPGAPLPEGYERAPFGN